MTPCGHVLGVVSTCGAVAFVVCVIEEPGGLGVCGVLLSTCGVCCGDSDTRVESVLLE